MDTHRARGSYALAGAPSGTEQSPPSPTQSPPSPGPGPAQAPHSVLAQAPPTPTQPHQCTRRFLGAWGESFRDLLEAMEAYTVLRN